MFPYHRAKRSSKATIFPCVNRLSYGQMMRVVVRARVSLKLSLFISLCVPSYNETRLGEQQNKAPFTQLFRFLLLLPDLVSYFLLQRPNHLAAVVGIVSKSTSQPAVLHMFRPYNEHTRVHQHQTLPPTTLGANIKSRVSIASPKPNWYWRRVRAHALVYAGGGGGCAFMKKKNVLDGKSVCYYTVPKPFTQKMALKYEKKRE